MWTSAVLILLLILTCLTLGGFAHYRYTLQERQDLKHKLRAHSQKAEHLSKEYDIYRKKFLDLDDRYREVKNMEQTYRVAYQEWKQKYEDLVERGRYKRVSEDSAKDMQEKTSAKRSDKREDDNILYTLSDELQAQKRLLARQLELFEQQSHQYETLKNEVRQLSERLERLKSVKRSGS